jgi:phosphate transport system substrate-binding protein
MNGKPNWMKNLVGAAAVCIAACHSMAAFSAGITGAGSTFVYPLLLKWAATYHTKTGQEVTFQPTGSGNGVW